jgi:hypothetical protein
MKLADKQFLSFYLLEKKILKVQLRNARSRLHLRRVEYLPFVGVTGMQNRDWPLAHREVPRCAPRYSTGALWGPNL